MNILFYAGDGVAKELQEMIEQASFRLEVYRSTGSLRGRLRRPLDDLTTGVLVADSRECLEELLGLRPLLQRVRILLVLPDRESGTISKGHALRARFLTYLDSDLLEVRLVLNKMREFQESGKGKGDSENEAHEVGVRSSR